MSFARKNVASGKFLQFPETLRAGSYFDSDPLHSTVDYEAAVAQAKEHDDLQTIFFINFPAKVEGDALREQQKLQSLLQSWQAWASTTCEGKILQQIDIGGLPIDINGQVLRGAYRAKVFDYLFRSSIWFAKTFDENMSIHVEAKQADFHSEILSRILKDFSVPNTVFEDLEKILERISEGIVSSSESSSRSPQYWIMLTKYNWSADTQTMTAVVRVIQFRVDQSAKQYCSNKASYIAVKCDLEHHHYQADFNSKFYSSFIRPKMDENLVKLGEELVARNSVEVTIPA
ncbi:hypothetical protein PFICI_15329 [Pestalotiopsis fici W106-1]|uniref:Uncharacterized protein n=1 Tax=Pestalotiopsis fici (strain W106-1 / CGMCC3.15140) TaxID=1229662 RepID=W3WIG2_PESFW|nr:uncharacterized protein PFICI_15329 [Pestalotiopsis fici W106-1]ETS72937.1 hypothetical protein PFICI_15329 [Pestalotiopsis fici W106-1]